MKKLIYLFGLCITILASCDPDEPCSTCFEDIVRCKVNGKEWVSNCKSSDPLFGCRAVKSYYYFNTDLGLDIGAGNDKNNSGITINQASGWGGAKLGSNSIEFREFRYRDYSKVNNCIFLDSINFNYNNYFILDHVDTSNYIIQGRFSFQITNNCGDTATITEGYFKTKFLF